MWESAKKLDETYMGPEYFWGFFQLGDFDKVDYTIVKWEIWSSWRIKAPTELDKGAFVGSTCGLFFYWPDKEDSVTQMKECVNLYLTKRKSNLSPIIVVGIFDHKKFAAGSLETQAHMKEQKEFIESKKGILLNLSDEIISSDFNTHIRGIYIKFMYLLRPDLCKILDIENNFWYLGLEELRDILMKEKKGIYIIPRHAPPPPPEPVRAEMPERVKEAEKPVEFQERKLRLEDLTDEERKYVAIGPDGDIIPLESTVTQEVIMDLVKKGYKLPPWVVIPRHCPKCFNQNQKTIHEIMDKTIVLMLNPPIYGKKFVCGNCSKEFH
jgi:hypothetical protein